MIYDARIDMNSMMKAGLPSQDELAVSLTVL
jgi:hypothetical protein